MQFFQARTVRGLQRLVGHVLGLVRLLGGDYVRPLWAGPTSSVGDVIACMLVLMDSRFQGVLPCVQHAVAVFLAQLYTG